jgi:transposase InsO family protein
MPSSSINGSDNGGEYALKEFVNFCKDVGIKRELTTLYNPQQNGVAERKNKTMLEVVKIKIFLCAYGQKQQ